MDCKRKEDTAVMFHVYSQSFSTRPIRTNLYHMHWQSQSLRIDNALFGTNSSPSFPITVVALRIAIITFRWVNKKQSSAWRIKLSLHHYMMHFPHLEFQQRLALGLWFHDSTDGYPKIFETAFRGIQSWIPDVDYSEGKFPKAYHNSVDSWNPATILHKNHGKKM